MKVWIKLPTDFHPQHHTNGMVSVDPVEGWTEYVPVESCKKLSKSDSISQEQLTEIAERAAKATPGPWRSSGYDIVAPKVETVLAGCLRLVLGNPDHLQEADQAFIAHARTDIPALLAHITTLREALAFYANPETWKGQECVGTSGIPWVCETTDADTDLGDRARAALAAAKGDKS